MADSAFYKLGRIAGVQVRKAKWMWASVAGNEADGIRAEQAVGRDMAAVVLEETPRSSDRTTQALLDEIGGKLAAVVRNRLHRFQTTAIESDRPTAFALPGGFIFIARSLVQLCDRNKDDVAFVLAHEMAHVIRRHAIERLPQQKVVNAVALASPAEGRSRPGSAGLVFRAWSAPTRRMKNSKRTNWASCSCALPASTLRARSACCNAWARSIGVLTLSA